MDWHYDGNQMALCSDDHTLQIFDLRENKVSLEIPRPHQDCFSYTTGLVFGKIDPIRSVRWSLCGTMLATAAEEVVVTDVRSLRQLFISDQDPSGTTHNSSSRVLFIILRGDKLSLFHQRIIIEKK